MTLRNALVGVVVLGTAFVGSRFVAGRVISEKRAASAASAASTSQVIVAGATPPNWVVHQTNGAVPGRTLLDKEKPTIVVLIASGCQSCTVEFPLIDLLAGEQRQRAKFVVLVCGKELAEVDQAAKIAKAIVTFGLCDSLMRRSWDVRALPLVAVLSPDSRVHWVRNGQYATEDLRRYLDSAGALERVGTKPAS